MMAPKKTSFSLGNYSRLNKSLMPLGINRVVQNIPFIVYPTVTKFTKDVGQTDKGKNVKIMPSFQGCTHKPSC